MGGAAMLAHKRMARALFIDSIRHTPARQAQTGNAQGAILFNDWLTNASILLKHKTQIGRESCGGIKGSDGAGGSKETGVAGWAEEESKTLSDSSLFQGETM
jgi:hypothetical protein